MRASFNEVIGLLRSKHSSDRLHGDGGGKSLEHGTQVERVNASSSLPPAGMAGAEDLLHKVLQKLEEQSLAISCQNFKIEKQSEMLERQAAEIASMRSALSSPSVSNTVRGEYSEGRACAPASASKDMEESPYGSLGSVKSLLHRADILPYVHAAPVIVPREAEPRNGESPVNTSEVLMRNNPSSVSSCVLVCVCVCLRCLLPSRTLADSSCCLLPCLPPLCRHT